MKSIQSLRSFLYENIADITEDAITEARKNGMDDADIAAALLVEYLLSASSVCVVNDVTLAEMLTIATDAYNKMVLENLKLAKIQQEKLVESEKKAPEKQAANVIPFPVGNKTVH